MNLNAMIASQIRKRPRLAALLVRAAHKVSPERVAVLDYPLTLRQRWDYATPHRAMYDIINRNRELYRSSLRAFLPLSDYLARIPERYTADSKLSDPCWSNRWMPALDGISIYGFLAIHKPKIYMEVGSGMSTKFARKAIVDHNLDTHIVSIDPCPRAEVNVLCDEVIRQPVEEVDVREFDRLDANDVLFIDNSHRVFMNSDVTTMFLDVLPGLKPGVLVEIHDVFLPYDYPKEWIHRYYSEQYLLAAYILAQGNMFDIILPNTFVSQDDELRSIMCPLQGNRAMKDVEMRGLSMWIRMNQAEENGRLGQRRKAV